jgi:hypothetical protein
MSINFSTTVRNAELDSIETAIGTAPILAMCSGSKPANCAAGETGTRIATMTLPSDWMANAASGAKSKSGTWQDPSADNTGTLGYFRVYDSGGTTCHIQGTITLTGGGGDMTVDNTSVVAAQVITVTTFTLNAGNS